MSSNPSLTIANLFATYLSFKALQSPNPPPANQHQNDRIFRIPLLGASAPKLGSAIFVILSLSHTLIVAKGITPTSPPTIFCPKPENLNMEYFTWNPYTKTCLTLIFASGILRLAAYRALGKNFTFELAKPTTLKTTGIYHYVQHPSYLPLIIIVTANMALFGNLDGAKGCVLPVRVVEIAKGLKWWGLAVWVAVWVRVIWCRVVDEEDMLKKEFGREWVSWNGRTARFIPWVI